MKPLARYVPIISRNYSPNPDPRGWRGGESDVLRRVASLGYDNGLADWDRVGLCLVGPEEANEDPWPDLVETYRAAWSNGRRDASQQAEKAGKCG